MSYAVIGNAVVTTYVGVRQGSPTSCLLFVNDFIKMFKENCDLDGLLSWLHFLMLMDDTVLLVTTRECMIRKVTVMHKFCNSYVVKVNRQKTKIVNGTGDDVQPVYVNNLVMQPCSK